MTNIETVAFSGSLVLPVIVGVASLLLSGATILNVGAWVSILPVSVSVVLLPAASATEAETPVRPLR
ncbi:hypothetical protein P4S73_10180 [Paraglaciecola sp. Hal342]